jgi:hypothetical protein
MDERFFLHRYKSSSHAAMVGAAGMGGLFFYDLIANGVIRWDLEIILGAMVVTKLGFLLYFRRFD